MWLLKSCPCVLAGFPESENSFLSSSGKFLTFQLLLIVAYTHSLLYLLQIWLYVYIIPINLKIYLSKFLMLSLLLSMLCFSDVLQFINSLFSCVFSAFTHLYFSFLKLLKFGLFLDNLYFLLTFLSFSFISLPFWTKLILCSVSHRSVTWSNVSAVIFAWPPYMIGFLRCFVILGSEITLAKTSSVGILKRICAFLC